MRLRPTLLVALTLAVAAAAPAPAQDGDAPRNTVEIDPFVGYRWDGTLEGDNGLFRQSVDIDQSAVYGLRVDFGVTDAFQVELLASRQPTRFTNGDTLFGRSDNLPDVTIDALHLGFLFQSSEGRVRPYGIVSVGSTRLAPDVPDVSSVSRLSMSGGGGIKVYMTPHVGMRFEGRVFWTDTDRASHWWDDHDLWQKEATAGLILGF